MSADLPPVVARHCCGHDEGWRIARITLTPAYSIVAPSDALLSRRRRS
ncbi:hypothetical protein AB0D38_02075 [Streptomyces sp. NPDC048279]